MLLGNSKVIAQATNDDCSYILQLVCMQLKHCNKYQLISKANFRSCVIYSGTKERCEQRFKDIMTLRKLKEA